MSDIASAVLAALFAVIVFAIGQIIQKWMLEPIQEQRKIVGEIAFALAFYANVNSSRTKEVIDETSTNLRTLASRFRATLWTIPCYRLLAMIGMVRKRKDVLLVSSELIAWSNSVHETMGGDQYKSSIGKVLKIAWDR